MQHDSQQEQQDARHQNNCANAGPCGPLPSAHGAGNSPLALAAVQPDALQTHSQAQRLLLGHRHHSHALLLAAGQEAAPQVSRQAERPLLGDGQWQHVAAVAGQADEDGRVLRGVGDSDDGDDVRVVWELRDGQTGGQFGDTTAPRAADLLLGAAHLGQTDRAAGVSAVQELGPPPGAVVVKADLALQNRVLGKSLHVGKVHSAAGPNSSEKSVQLQWNSNNVEQVLMLMQLLSTKSLCSHDLSIGGVVHLQQKNKSQSLETTCLQSHPKMFSLNYDVQWFLAIENLRPRCFADFLIVESNFTGVLIY